MLDDRNTEMDTIIRDATTVGRETLHSSTSVEYDQVDVTADHPASLQHVLQALRVAMGPTVLHAGEKYVLRRNSSTSYIYLSETQRQTNVY